MKHLVVVRHGYYGDRSLTEEGRQQIEGLGAILAERLKGSSIALLSSTATRAKETSEILARHFGGIAFEEHEFLHSGGSSFYGGQEHKALALVEERGQTHDVIVLSTHLEFIDDFPPLWGQKMGFSLPHGNEISKGTARFIDATTGQEELIRAARA